MALTITNTTLTNPANKTQLQDNFTDIVNKFNAGITNADLSSTAGITNTQLANSIYEFTITLNCTDVVWQSADGAGDILALAGLPGTSGSDGTYTGIVYSWACTDIGSSTGLFRVEWGYFTAGGVWTVVSTPIDNITMNAYAGGATFTTAFTLATDFTAANQGPRMFALVMDTDDANALSTTAGTPNFLSVTMKLKRTLGLRA